MEGVGLPVCPCFYEEEGLDQIGCRWSLWSVQYEINGSISETRHSHLNNDFHQTTKIKVRKTESHGWCFFSIELKADDLTERQAETDRHTNRGRNRVKLRSK